MERGDEGVGKNGRKISINYSTLRRIEESHKTWHYFAQSSIPITGKESRLLTIANLLNCVFSLLMWEGWKNILPVCGLPLLWLTMHTELIEYLASKGIWYHLTKGNTQMYVICKSDTPGNAFIIGQRHHSRVYFANWGLLQRSPGAGSQKRARKTQSFDVPHPMSEFILRCYWKIAEVDMKKSCLFSSRWRLKVQDQAAAFEDLWSITWLHVRWMTIYETDEQSVWKNSFGHAGSRRQDSGLLS